MTTNPPDSVTDLQWLLSEMERAGLSAEARERLLRLLCQVAEGGGLSRRELRLTLWAHVAQRMLDSGIPASCARRRLPTVLGCTKRSAERLVTRVLTQRTARAFAFGG